MANTDTLTYLLNRFGGNLFPSAADAAGIFGMTAGGVRNALLKNRFPCPTTKLGSARVIPIRVLARFIDDKTAECIDGNTGETKGKPGRKTKKEKEEEAVLLADRKRDLRTNSDQQQKDKALARQVRRAAV